MQQVIGQLDPNRKLKTITGEDPWKDSPFFAPGMETDSEHMLAMPIGNTLGGIFKGMREAKTTGKGEKNYAIFTDINGNNFKMRSPGKLTWELSKAKIGQYVEITYKGKAYAESLDTDVHDFDVKIEEDSSLQ